MRVATPHVLVSDGAVDGARPWWYGGPTVAQPGAFRPGPDSRRGLGARKPGPRKPRLPTLMDLARNDRPATLAALQRLRDQTDEPRIALEASTLLARYSDGDPGAHNVPPPPEEVAADGEESFEPPPLDPAVEAAIDGPRGGDAGSPGEGNGGAA